MTKIEIQEAIRTRFGAQLEEWKKLHGVIKGYGADGKIGVFRAANIQTLEICRAASNGNNFRYDIALVENCWLGGDEELLRDDKYKLGVLLWAETLVEFITGEMVEL